MCENQSCNQSLKSSVGHGGPEAGVPLWSSQAAGRCSSGLEHSCQDETGVSWSPHDSILFYRLEWDQTCGFNGSLGGFSGHEGPEEECDTAENILTQPNVKG